MTKKTVYYLVYIANGNQYKQIGTETTIEDDARKLCDKWNNNKDKFTTGVYEVRSATVNMDR